MLAWFCPAHEEFSFWLCAIGQCHGQPFWKKDPQVSGFSRSNASDSGWGGFLSRLRDPNWLGEIGLREWWHVIYVQHGASFRRCSCAKLSLQRC